MPCKTPLLIAVSVEQPTRGASPLLSTKGSREVYSCNAFKRIVGPGEMFPPKYSADELIKS